MKALAALLLSIIAHLLSGCVATKYQFAGTDHPPAVTLDLRPAHSPVDMHLDAIITRGAPGSWKRDALWDEYALFLANRTKRRWRIESVSLVTVSGRIVQPGTDPWELEEITADWWRQSGIDAAHGMVWGVGQVAGVGAAGVAMVGLSVLQAGVVARPDLAVQIIGAVHTAAVVPQALTAPAEVNAKSRQEVAVEFQRRRAALLAPLPPGREARGSAFFPITRQARQLIFVCSSGTETRKVTIDLPLAEALAANESAAAETRNLRIVPAGL
jgi:hypothetical protein